MVRHLLHRLAATIYVSVLALLPYLAFASPVITFEPTQGSVGVGGLVSVAVRISGLTDNSAPALGAFDIGVRFDPLVLAFNDVTYGDPALGDQLDLSGFGSLTLTTPPFTVGSLVELGLSEISLDDVDTLNNLQAGDFVLAVLTFNGVGIGSSPLELVINSLADAVGSTDAFAGTSVGSGSVAVIREPDSATLTLLALGLVFLLSQVSCSTTLVTGGRSGA